MAEPKDSEKKDAAKKPAAKKPAAKSASSSTAKKPAAKKPAAKKESSGGAKPAAKKQTPAKAEAKKPAAKKPAAKKAPAKPKGAAEPKAEPKRAATKEPSERPVVNARASHVRVAPRKARLVADQVRGLPLDDALTMLRFSPRGAARDIAKLISSAAANAENNHDLVADELMISDITVDEGPTLRRYQARALGRATRINKRTSHIKVALTPEDED
jgi:large subunit ribosomal protein L22